jgi:NAD(P)-dependent dehydrogenase (short-subunit alcohol dehydrogenase family)
MSSTKNQRVILVTGANKGIGLEVIRKLAKNPSYNNDIILLGSRDLKRGQDALKQLDSPSNVHVLQLDTSSSESISHAVDEIKRKYGGQLDILINNAAVWIQELTVNAARELLQTNYYGLKILNKQLFPLLRENARVVNVSSSTGPWALHNYSSELREKYLSPTLTIEQLDRLIEDFISAIETKNLKALGYENEPSTLIYSLSKVAVNALTRIQARQWSGNKNITTYSVCPGFCSTDLSHHAPGSRPPELGADSILYVVDTPQNELENGEFYRDGIKKSQSFEVDIDVGNLQEHIEKHK